MQAQQPVSQRETGRSQADGRISRSESLLRETSTDDAMPSELGLYLESGLHQGNLQNLEDCGLGSDGSQPDSQHDVENAQLA